VSEPTIYPSVPADASCLIASIHFVSLNKKFFLGSTAYSNLVLFFFFFKLVRCTPGHIAAFRHCFVISQKWQGGNFRQYKQSQWRWLATL